MSELRERSCDNCEYNMHLLHETTKTSLPYVEKFLVKIKQTFWCSQCGSYLKRKLTVDKSSVEEDILEQSTPSLAILEKIEQNRAKAR